MMASGPAASTVPAGTSGAAPSAYGPVRTLIVKVIFQNDVRRLQCACVSGIQRARRGLPDIRLQKSFALQFFKRSAPDLPSSRP